MSVVTLNGIALDLDPERYLMLDGDRRGSVHRLVSGDSIFQDRGAHKNDLVITLEGKLTSATTLTSLLSLYNQTGITFTLADFKDCAFTVQFTPGAKSFTAEPIRGSNSGFNYRISLSVITVTKWFGVIGGYPS